MNEQNFQTVAINYFDNQNKKDVLILIFVIILKKSVKNVLIIDTNNYCFTF